MPTTSWSVVLPGAFISTPFISQDNYQMTTPAFLDGLRSTRSRIAKPRVRAQQSAMASNTTESDDTLRDFSRYLGDKHPLRIIFVGHNPSDKSWEIAAPYAHPTNKFWRLLRDAQLAPPHLCKASEYKQLPRECGIGFIDLFVTSGSDASKIGRDALKQVDWKQNFFTRLTSGTGGVDPLIICCVSKIVATKLLSGWKGEFGKVGTGRDWNLQGAETSEVWVLPSSSGRAGLTWEARLNPFKQLKARTATFGAWEE